MDEMMIDLQNTDPSNSRTRKKNPLIDEDFEKDFLSSWNSSKMHKDALDFDVEAVPRKNKKTFNFDELDDFGLGPDFDKLSSFGILDLDFSKPLKKTEKDSDRSSKESVEEMRDPRSDNFSFAFDFKGLNVFEADANMVNGGKQVSKTMTEAAPANSAECRKDVSIKCNSIKSTDVLERSEAQMMANSDSISTSKSAQVVESSAAHDSTLLSDTLTQVDISHEAQQAVEKQISGIEENTKLFFTKSEQREQSDEICLYQTKSCIKSVAQEFVQFSTSSNESAKDAFPKIQKDFISSGSLKDNLSNEESNIRRHESLKSRDTSPVNSCNSRSRQAKDKVESRDSANKFQNHEVNQIKIIGGSEMSDEHTDVIEDTVKEIACKVSHGMNSFEIEDPTSKHLSSPLNQVPKLLSSIHNIGESRLPLQVNSLNKPESATFHKKAKLLPLQLNGRCSMQMNSNDSYQANAKKDCKINVEGTVEQKCSVSASDDKSNTKVEADVTGSGSYTGSDDLCTKLFLSNLIGKTTTQNAKTSIPKMVSSVLMSPQMKTYEGQDFTQKDVKKLKTLSFMNSRLSKPTGNTMNSLIPKGRNLNTLSEGSLATIVAGSDTTNQCAQLNSSLKRKTPEVETDPTLNPMKRMESSSLERRVSIDVFPKDDTNEVQRSEDPEDLGHDARADNLTCIASATGTENLVDLELPALIENDGNVEKAEALSKELDDICSMLRKKHEEAKDLLVRAIVNNNSLLMLDHPMIQSKIRALQRFARGLRTREYWRN